MSENGTSSPDPDDRNRARPEQPAEGDTADDASEEREHTQEPAEGGEDQT